MSTLTTYGPGGYDPNAPDGNVVSVRAIDTPDVPLTADQRLSAALEGLSDDASAADILAALRSALG
jgi:hypothetical protein